MNRGISYFPPLLTTLLVLVAFVAGVVVEATWSSPPTKSKSVLKTEASEESSMQESGLAESEQQDADLRAQVAYAEQQLADFKAKEDADILADRLSFFQKHQILLIGKYDYAPRGQPVKLSPDMAALLGLSKEEQQAVESDMTRAAKEMEQLEDANTTLTKQTANSFTLDIPPNPEGKTVETNLANKLADDIGPDRADFLMTQQGPYYSDPFSGFAQQKIQWDVSWTEQNGTLMYSWKESGLNPDGRESGSGSGSGTSLPADIQKFVQPEPTP